MSASAESQPTRSPDPPEPASGVWLFQANPSRFNLAEGLAHGRAGDTDDWLVSRFRDQMRRGDVAVFWQAGDEAGIYALGEVDGVPEQQDAEYTTGADKEWRVPLRYTLYLHPHVPKASLVEDPVLRSMTVIRSPVGTNFRISPEEWDALRPLFAPSLPVTWVVRAWDDSSFEAFQERGLIAVGHDWKVTQDLSGLDKPAIREVVAGANPDRKPGWVDAARDQLDLVVNGMQPEHLVFGLRPGEPLLVGVVDGPYTFDPSTGDTPHTRRVRWISEASRSAIPPALSSRLDARPGTVWRMNDADDGLLILTHSRGRAKSCWWVNQNANYPAERDSGYVWAPQAARDGHPRSFHTALLEVRPGDAVIHYANSAIRAVSRVTTRATEGQQPNATGDEADRAGYVVKTQYAELESPIALSAIPAELRIPQNGPFSSGGSVRCKMSRSLTCSSTPRSMPAGSYEAGHGAPDRVLPSKPDRSGASR